MIRNSSRFDFEGASVLVTGGTGGIGAAVTRSFADAGAAVTITGTRPRKVDYRDDLSDYAYFQLDLEDHGQIDALAETMPTCDILINSAGIAFFALGQDESDPDVFDRALNMHLSSVNRLASKLHSKLAASPLKGGASIVNVASMSSFFGIAPAVGYGAAKTGLVGLTRTLAVRWGGEGIRVNAVAAGLTASKMTSGLLADAEINAGLLTRVPLGRHGQPEDIASAILFLCSENASWITGQTLPIDGGFTIAG